LDFTGKEVKLMRVEHKKEEIRVTESLELSIPDLKEYLRRNSRRIKEVRVSGFLENTFHKAFVLPNLKSKMLKEAVANEVVKAFGGGYQFLYQDLGEVGGPGTKVKRKVMTVGMERKALEELSRIFTGFKVKPSIFTTYPVALQTLLERMGLLGGESVGFVEIVPPKSRIAIFKEKEIRLVRELPLAGEGKDPENLALSKDIYRTLLFYTENFPEQRVTKLVVAGDSGTPETLKNLREKTGVEIILFSPESLLQRTEDVPGVHPGCLGLALVDPRQFSFGFVPLSVQERRKMKKTVTFFSFIFLGILLIFVLVVLRLSLNLKNLSVYQGGIKGEIKMKEDRLRELSLELVSHSIETSQPPWTEILLELAAVVPPGVSFKSMTLRKTRKGWMGEVKGIAEGSDEITSLVLVEKLQNNFNQSPLFSGIKLMEKKLQGKVVAFKIIYQLRV